MNDLVTLLIIFGVLVGFTWFVWRKAKKAGSFTKWLWMSGFGAVSAFLIYMVFVFFIHIENAILKQLTMFITLAVVTPPAGWIGGMIYDKRK